MYMSAMADTPVSNASMRSFTLCGGSTTLHEQFPLKQAYCFGIVGPSAALSQVKLVCAVASHGLIRACMPSPHSCPIYIFLIN